MYSHSDIKCHTFSSLLVFVMQCHFCFTIILCSWRQNFYWHMPSIGSKYLSISKYSRTFLRVYQNPISSGKWGPLQKQIHPVCFVFDDGRSVSKSPAESRSAQVTFKCRPLVLRWLWCPPLARSAICMVICKEPSGAECCHHYPENPHSCSPKMGIDNHHNDNN